MKTKTKFRATRSRRGVTLIECMVAVTVLTATVAGLVMPFSLAAKAQRLDAMQTTATTLANQQMERLVLLSKEDVLALNGTTEVGGDITGIDGQPINHNSLSEFTRSIAASEVTITESGVDGEASFVRATVTVARTGMPDVTLTRLFGDVGFYGQASNSSDDDADDADAADSGGDDTSDNSNSNAGGNGNGNGFGGNNSDQTGNSNDNGVGGSNHNSNSNSNAGGSSGGSSWLDNLFDRLNRGRGRR